VSQLKCSCGNSFKASAETYVGIQIYGALAVHALHNCVHCGSTRALVMYEAPQLAQRK
jgi:hypothetical protein